MSLSCIKIVCFCTVTFSVITCKECGFDSYNDYLIKRIKKKQKRNVVRHSLKLANNFVNRRNNSTSCNGVLDILVFYSILNSCDSGVFSQCEVK